MKINIKTKSNKQKQKYFQKLPSLVDTAAHHGAKYFNFLPDKLRDLALNWFNSVIDTTGLL